MLFAASFQHVLDRTPIAHGVICYSRAGHAQYLRKNTTNSCILTKSTSDTMFAT